MTVSTSSTRELDINRIALLAAQVAGLLPAGAPQSGVQWEKYARQARDFLELEIDGIQAEGLLARTVEFYDVQLVAGTTTYTLPSTTLSVIGDAMYAAPGSENQQLVAVIDRDRYHLIANKDTDGTPSLFYAQSHGVVTLFVWPVPDAAGVLTVQRQRLLYDNDDGTNTVDLERHWMKYVVFAVGHWMALSNGIDPSKCGYLNAKAEKALMAALSRSAQPTPGQIENDHRSGWNR